MPPSPAIGDSFPRNLGIGLGSGLGLHDVLSPSSFAVSVVLMDTPVRTSYGPHPQRPHWHRLPNKAKTRLNTPHGVMCFYHVPTVGLRARRCALGLDVAFSTTVRRKIPRREGKVRTPPLPRLRPAAAYRSVPRAHAIRTYVTLARLRRGSRDCRLFRDTSPRRSSCHESMSS
jgi:hypothetical protein